MKTKDKLVDFYYICLMKQKIPFKIHFGIKILSRGDGRRRSLTRLVDEGVKTLLDP